jgi:hypothetical protein
MKPLFAFRFAIAAVLVSVGCLLMLTEFARISIISFGLAVVFFMPRSELHGPVRRLELWALLGILLLFVAAAFFLSHAVPTSATKSVERVARHPAFVCLIWFLMMCGLYAHWKQQQSESEV